MKFKIDENLPIDVAELLRQAGHDGATIIDQNMEGYPDREIATVCNRERRVLITLDTDFADIRTYPPESYYGIIVFRLKHQDKLSVLEVLKKVLPLLSERELTGKLWIVSEHQIRERE